MTREARLAQLPWKSVVCGYGTTYRHAGSDTQKGVAGIHRVLRQRGFANIVTVFSLVNMASVCQLLSQECSRGASHACWNGRILLDPTTFSFSLALVLDIFGLATTEIKRRLFPYPENFWAYDRIPGLLT